MSSDLAVSENGGVPLLCPYCQRMLAEAGTEGRKLRAAGGQCWLGHGGGRFASRGAPEGDSQHLRIGLLAQVFIPKE